MTTLIATTEEIYDISEDRFAGSLPLDVPAEDDRLTEDDRAHLASVLGHEISENTRRNYDSQWRRFTVWAREKGIRTLPADPLQVAAYLAERLERHGHKPATLQTAAAAIRFMHRDRGLPDPCESADVRNTLRSARRKAGMEQKQAEGLTDEALEAIVATACLRRRWSDRRTESAEAAKRRGMLDIAIVRVMRDALLRVSEAAELLWEDIVEEEAGTGRLLIRRSKTDPEGEGAVAFLSASTMQSLRAIRAGAPDDGRVIGLSAGSISRRIGQAALAAGLGEGFSGHSPRVGMARDLARTGTELTRLITAGRWSSPWMPALYTRNETVARGAVAHYYGSRGAFGMSSKVAAVDSDEDDLREDCVDGCVDRDDVCSVSDDSGKSCEKTCNSIHTAKESAIMPEPIQEAGCINSVGDVRRIRALIRQVPQGILGLLVLLRDLLPISPAPSGAPSLFPVHPT